MTGHDDADAIAGLVDPDLLARFRRAGRRAGVAVAALGTLVLIGWGLDWPALQSVVPGQVTMKPNTASCFVLAGVALWLAARGQGSRRSHHLVLAAASVVVAVGMVTLAEYAFDLDLGIDQVLFDEAANPAATAPPGRMAPTTALLVVTAGVLLVRLQRRGRLGWPAQLAAGGGALLAFLNLVGYVYKVPALNGPGRWTWMSVHTALAFIGLFLGIAAASGDAGATRLFATVGPAGLLLRRLVHAVVAVPFLLGWLRLEGQRLGFYGTELGLSLHVMTVVVLFAAMLIGTARSLARVDAERAAAAAQLEERARALAASEHRLAHQAEELRQSNAELEQFAYVASHDLAEPLRTVAGYVKLLARRYQGRLDAEADELIGQAVDGCARMKALIDGLLAYSRVGRSEVQPTAVDCERLVADVLSSLQARLAETDAVVEVAALPTVRGDPMQLAQLFQNLVANAVKFTRPGVPPHIQITADRDGPRWRFVVADNGIGIDPQYRDRIFGMFQRLHARDRYPGTGIGLAICKRIVHAHGGMLCVDDNPGGGTRFSFTLDGEPREAMASSRRGPA